MNSASVPLHVFISYSRVNSDFVRRLTDDLRRRGITVWVDDKGLTPGTPDWESAIRDAIDASFAILLVATPESRQSVHVKGELNIAEARGIPVYPIWAAENTWIDCIPLSMSNTQYIECRPSNYGAGVDTVTDRLKSVADSVMPRHHLLEPLTKIVDSDRYKRPRHVPIPSGYVCVELPSGEQGQQAAAGVIMKVSSYPSFLSLLDDLYTHYLRERFKPFTYGRDWVLDNAVGGHVLAVPFSWLKFSDRGQYKFDRKWAMATSLETVGLTPGTHWEVVDAPVGGVKGIVVNDPRVLRAVLTNPKAQDMFFSSGYLEYTTMGAVNPDEYHYAAVAKCQDFYERQSPETVVIKQTARPVDEAEIQFWGLY
jgi:hypothetical protein